MDYKILIIGPSWVGDMVMAQSLFIRLKERIPNAVIDVLAMAWTKPLLERMPEVRNALSLPISHGVFGMGARYQLAQQLKPHRYDQAIILPNSWKSALIPWFARIPLRTGWRGEMRYGLLNDLRILDKPSLPLMVQRFVSLAHHADEASTAPDYPIPKMLASPPRRDVKKNTLEQKRVVLCPGAEFGPAKQWPASAYAELAKSLIEKNWQVLILGSKADQKIAHSIVNQVSKIMHGELINLCGETELQDAIDLIGTADAVVSNDSGLMHIAAALQRPLVAIYGPTSPDFTPPLSPSAQQVQLKVDCGPCFQRQCPEQHHRCMHQISAEKVLSHLELALTKY